MGRPNVGKSTLLNRILGQKLSITSRKPQTTRHRILGIKSTERSQVIYVDTPGLHARAQRALNRYMNRAASNAIQDVDVVVFLFDARGWTEEDASVLEKLRRAKLPIVFALNKVDKLRQKSDLLPRLDELSRIADGHDLIPISGLKGDGVERLEGLVESLLPEGVPIFPEDQLTDRSERFIVAELIREKLINRLGQELPYRLSVEIEYFEEGDGRTDIGAIVWVERATQKAMVIGKQGTVLKGVGIEARAELEQMFSNKVNVKLWAKVKEGWSNDERALRGMGYD